MKRKANNQCKTHTYEAVMKEKECLSFWRKEEERAFAFFIRSLLAKGISNTPKKAEISIPTGSPHQLHYQTIFVTLPLPF